MRTSHINGSVFSNDAIVNTVSVPNIARHRLLEHVMTTKSLVQLRLPLWVNGEADETQRSLVALQLPLLYKSVVVSGKPVHYVESISKILETDCS